jgi:uncharacterized protein (DUF952 family)
MYSTYFIYSNALQITTTATNHYNGYKPLQRLQTTTTATNHYNGYKSLQRLQITTTATNHYNGYKSLQIPQMQYKYYNALQHDLSTIKKLKKDLTNRI